MSQLSVKSKRLAYRLGYKALHLSAIFIPSEGRGVKCLFTHAGEVLLVRHTYGRREVWYLPGGGVHRRERPIEAAAREMLEELGLRHLELREIKTVPLEIGRRRVNITVVHSELLDRALKPDPGEIEEVRWFEVDCLPAPLGPEVRSLIALIAEQLRS